MSADLAPAKNPRRVRSGLAGAAARWGEGPPRVAHLDGLTADQRRAIFTMIEAVKVLSGFKS